MYHWYHSIHSNSNILHVASISISILFATRPRHPRFRALRFGQGRRAALQRAQEAPFFDERKISSQMGDIKKKQPQVTSTTHLVGL